MSRRGSSLLRDERGQSVVLFVISISALMGVLALVVNVGNWLQSQRHLQTVADATAMEAAQSNHDTFAEVSSEAPNAAQAMATSNWDGSVLTRYSFEGGLRNGTKSSLDIAIETQHEVGYLFQNMLTFLGVSLNPLTFTAQAETRIDSPIGLNQVAPIAVKCPPPCSRPWPGFNTSIFDSARTWPLDPQDTSTTSDDTPIEFEFRPAAANRPDSTFFPVERFAGATINDVQADLQSCDPIVTGSGSCDQSVVTTGPGSDSQPVIDPDPAPNPDAFDAALADEATLRSALDTVGGWPHLVMVYDTYDDATGELHIVGFAAFTFTVELDPDPLVPDPVIIRGTFHKLFYDTAHTPGGGDYDFGVRTIALSG
jgi:Flp pilus assembly protein TadG